MKKPSQESLIFSFLLKNPNTRPKDIAKKLKMPEPSVRRSLFGLRKKNIITTPNVSKTSRIKQNMDTKIYAEKIKAVETKEIEKIKSKELVSKKYILNIVMYCSSKPKTAKSTTYSNESFDSVGILNLMINMQFAINDKYSSICSDIAYNSGLDISEVKTMPFVYPDIEVTYLKKLSLDSLDRIQKGMSDFE